MLTKAHQEGIRTIIATPHYELGRANMPVQELKDIHEAVQQEANKIDENFRIVLGNELLYSNGILEALGKESALTLGGTRYILVEFLPSISYSNIREGIHRCVLMGYIPMIAHAERYQCLLQNINLVKELIDVGAYIQLNLSSTLGGFMNQRANFCRKLFDREWVHCIGTDSHNTELRAPQALSAIANLQKRYGEEYVERIIRDNPSKLLNNKYI
jgi:protein-tyrosine phosphatase